MIKPIFLQGEENQSSKETKSDSDNASNGQIAGAIAYIEGLQVTIEKLRKLLVGCNLHGVIDSDNHEKLLVLGTIARNDLQRVEMLVGYDSES